jgi:hypothetical protein
MERAGEKTGEVGDGLALRPMKNQSEMTSLREVFAQLAKLDEMAWLYLSSVEPWRLDSKALVSRSEEVPPELEDDPEAGLPELARQHGLMQVLPISTVQEIVENARQQRPDVGEVALLKALSYYYDHDAFLSLSPDA